MAITRPRQTRRYSSSLVSEQERLTRKREQNRIAQQTYRRSQKERIQALEAAVAKSSSTGGDTWTQSDDMPGTDRMFINGSAETASLTSTTTAADPNNFSDTLFQPLLDLNLDPRLTLSLGNDHAGGPRDAFGRFQQSSHTSATDTVTAAAVTETTNTTASSFSFGQYSQQSHEARSAPAVITRYTRTEDISNLDSSSVSDREVMTASASEGIEEASAWSRSIDSHMTEDTSGSKSSDASVHDQSSSCLLPSTAQYDYIRGRPEPLAISLFHNNNNNNNSSSNNSSNNNSSNSSSNSSNNSSSNNNRCTALHIAACQGDSSIVELLLDRGADAGLLNKDGQTPLHLAVIAAAEAEEGCSGRRHSRASTISNGDGDNCDVTAKEAEKTVRLLLRARGAGAGPRAIDKSGRSVLSTAIATGSVATVKMVLDAMGDEGVGADGSAGFSPGSQEVESDVIRASIRAALDEPDVHGTLPLHLAVASGSAPMVLLLLSNGADINR